MDGGWGDKWEGEEEDDGKEARGKKCVELAGIEGKGGRERLIEFAELVAVFGEVFYSQEESSFLNVCRS